MGLTQSNPSNLKSLQTNRLGDWLWIASYRGPKLFLRLKFSHVMLITWDDFLFQISVTYLYWMMLEYKAVFREFRITQTRLQIWGLRCPSNLKSPLLRDNSGITLSKSYPPKFEVRQTPSKPKAIPQIWSQANSEQTPSKPWVIPEQTPSKPKAIQKLSPKFEVKQTLSLKFEVTQCVHKNVMMIRFGVSLAGRTSPFWPCFRVLDRNLTHRRTSSYSQCT